MSNDELSREIRADIRELFEKIDKIETRLFRGNGRKSIQEETSLNTAELACIRNDVSQLMRHQIKRPSASVSREKHGRSSETKRLVSRGADEAPSNVSKLRNGIAAALVAAVGSGGIASYLIDKLMPEKPPQSQPSPRPEPQQPPASNRQPALPAKQQTSEELRAPNY